MSDSEKSYSKAISEMDSYMEYLYDDADPDGGNKEADIEELAPMYQALTKIENRYERFELIGKGGMKEIYRVYDLRSARYVALAKPVKKLSKERFDAFLREAHLTARLEHPCIVNLFDMGVDEFDCPFFTMELKKGRSLREILRLLKNGEGTEEYSLRKRLAIVLRVCEAMAYAHSRRVLHLDLKPENIQIGAFGEVQVCDWGMGVVAPLKNKDLNESEVLLDPDIYGPLLVHARGTPEYMAPEQKNPQTPKTPRMDIYALGCLLQELVALKAPRRPVSEKEVSDNPLRAIIAKARHEDPEERYESVEEIHRDLFRYMGGYSTSVERAGFLREARLFYLRNRVPCRVSFFFTALLIASGIWFTQQLRVEYQKTEDALEQTKVALNAAEEAIARYERERELAGVLLERQSESVIDGSYILLDHLIMDESISLAAVENAIEEMDEALAQNPPQNDNLWAQKAYALFLTQRFSEATPVYQINDFDQADLRALAPEFGPLVAENGLLPLDVFVAFLHRLVSSKKDRWPLMEKMVIYYSLKRDSLDEISAAVRAMVDVSNPSWDSSEFDFESGRGHLRIGGPGLRSLIRPDSPRMANPPPRLCLLRLLDLHSLAIGSSDFTDLGHLNGLDLYQLDLRETSVEDLAPLASMSSLRELVIEPGQFSSEQLASLPGTIDVQEISLAAR